MPDRYVIAVTSGRMLPLGRSGGASECLVVAARVYENGRWLHNRDSGRATGRSLAAQRTGSRTRKHMSVESARLGDARRLALGPAVKLPIDEVRLFMEALRGSSYAGDVALLVRRHQWRLKSYLAAHGVRTFHSYPTRRISGRIHAYRFKRFAEYLRRHGGRYDQVLVSDVRDVV